MDYFIQGVRNCNPMAAEGVSEWVSDSCLNAKLSNFSATLWREKVNFQWDHDEVCFVLDQHA